VGNRSPVERVKQMFNIGDKVKAKALNDEAFIGTVIALDQQGFAYVSFNGISEARILISELEKQLTPDEIHLAMIEDVSNIVAKYFPNFDNNIEDQTWSFLVLFIEETIHQLGKETK
jgi:hypothetical protein